jgi:membrane protease YdiL (CAAX protease family)
MSAFGGRLDRKPVGTLSFFAAAFAMTWSCYAAGFWLRGSTASGSPLLLLADGILLLGVVAPALVSVSLTALDRGRAGLRVFFESIVPSHVGVGWFIFAAGFFLAIKLTAAVILWALNGAWPPFGTEPWYVMAVAVLFSTPVQAGEELGWRGYALPRMAARMGLGPASVVLGVVWAAWHLPLFVVAVGDTFHQSFPVYLLQVTAMSVVMAWLYWRTGRALLLVMLLHAAANNTKDVVPSAVAAPMGPWTLHASPVAWTTVALMWAVAGFLLIRMRGATLGDPDRGGRSAAR